MATAVAKYAGEPVAAVVATSRGRAQDALDMIDVEYESLPAGSCTCSLRLIQLPDKPGKIPSLQHVYEGVLPWYRIFSFTSSR